ncbi:MAG: glycosyltransferase [Chthoniobacterales bacterium]|nr:glycosyltransferase [Chthoniobacterales bacterium]
MRLVSLCHQTIPSHHTNTQQLVWTASELARLGHEVVVICRRSEDEGAEWRGRIASYYGLDALPDSIDFVPVGSANGGVLLPEVSADIRNVIAARGMDPDFVHTRDPVALTLALAAGLSCVFETYRVDLNESPLFAPWRALNYRRKNLLGIVTHSELCRQSFISARVSQERVQTNYNGYSPAQFTPPLTMEAARTQLGLAPTDRLVAYTGHVELTKGIDFVVRLAQELAEVTFLLVGGADGSEKERSAQRLIARAGVSNIRLVPRVAPKDVPAWLFASDCLLIPPTAAPLQRHGRTVLPMKTFSYLAAGRPIVAPELPDLREVLRHGENALLVPPDNVGAAAAAIRSVVDRGPLASQLGQTARRDAAKYTWGARAERFAAFLQNLGTPAQRSAR